MLQMMQIVNDFNGPVNELLGPNSVTRQVSLRSQLKKPANDGNLPRFPSLLRESSLWCVHIEDTHRVLSPSP